MVGETDKHDRNETRKITIVLISLVVLLLIGGAFMLPGLVCIIDIYLTPGLDLKESAIVSFFTTVIIIIIFAVTSGDGLLGEIQFMLSAFFLFFIIQWLFIAWIF